MVLDFINHYYQITTLLIYTFIIVIFVKDLHFNIYFLNLNLIHLFFCYLGFVNLRSEFLIKIIQINLINHYIDHINFLHILNRLSYFIKIYQCFPNPYYRCESHFLWVFCTLKNFLHN